MNKVKILGYICVFLIGLFLGVGGISYMNWEWWVLLILIFVYGETQSHGGKS